jgi:hypothetical protein
MTSWESVEINQGGLRVGLVAGAVKVGEQGGGSTMGEVVGVSVVRGDRLLITFARKATVLNWRKG